MTIKIVNSPGSQFKLK